MILFFFSFFFQISVKIVVNIISKNRAQKIEVIHCCATWDLKFPKSSSTNRGCKLLCRMGSKIPKIELNKSSSKIVAKIISRNQDHFKIISKNRCKNHFKKSLQKIVAKNRCKNRCKNHFKKSLQKIVAKIISRNHSIYKNRFQDHFKNRYKKSLQKSLQKSFIKN